MLEILNVLCDNLSYPGASNGAQVRTIRRGSRVSKHEHCRITHYEIYEMREFSGYENQKGRRLY